MKEKKINWKSIGLIFIGIIIGVFLVTEVLVMIKENIKFLTTDYETIEQGNTPKNEPKEEKETTEEKNNEDVKIPKTEEKNNTKEDTEVIEKNKSTETDVVSYFEETLEEETASEKLKNGFITVVDFIFYGKEIKGYTFKELTTEAKLKVVSLALKIDNKIEQYVPGYKDTIGEKYQNIKAKIVSKYLEITSQICETHEDTCKYAKEDFQNMKESFGITWDLIKDLGNIGIDKLKTWYEIFKESE